MRVCVCVCVSQRHDQVLQLLQNYSPVIQVALVVV
jgi:hypothetical protein